MIALLRGRVVGKDSKYLIVDVNGVGYRVFTTNQVLRDLAVIDVEISLHIHTAVRDDAIHLYGFSNINEKTIFERLLNVSGIGAKQAINIMSGLGFNELVAAICNKDILKLSSISGVGRKTADRLILELKDKLIDLTAPQIKTEIGESLPESVLERDILEALLALGYSRNEALNALRKAVKVLGDKADTEATIREALRYASKR